ncbi:MAG: exodeoxyribonuclease VII large subunit [Candidatus Alcyoniella australis]|nr:exodeoxyribonuclease VII large subunit [Candidatus Alcyoniella australis]
MEYFPGSERSQPLPVAQLVALVRRGLEQTFDDVAVQGEIRDLRRPASGHCYFTLAGEGAQIRCVLFRSRARLLRFEPGDGQSVIVRGQVTVYDARGDLQILAEYIEPTGVGAMMLALEQLKARLSAEGLFDADRKQPIPDLPQAVGVVTSATGAAIRDILNTIESRFPGLPVVLSPTLVQGQGAAEQIAGALQRLVDHAPEVEVIIVGRGGGSFEDLFAFNEESVVRAIARCPLPVISAVGHEIDWTLSDLVADERAATPTAAAQRAVANRAEVEESIENSRSRAYDRLRGMIDGQRDAVNALSSRLLDPRKLVQRTSQRLDDLGALIESAMRGRVQRLDERCSGMSARVAASSPDRRTRSVALLVQARFQRLIRAAQVRIERQSALRSSLDSRLQAAGPPAVIKRGYALVRGPDGKPLRDASALRVGDAVHVSLARGAFGALVQDVEVDDN